MADVNSYKCPACGGTLAFDAKTGKVVCEYCDSSFDVHEIESLYSDGGEGAQASEQDESFAEEDLGEESEWNTSGLNGSWGDDASHMKEYTCPSCGASIICEETTAATSCPYCNNPTVIETQFKDSLKPDYIIPFKLGKNEAVERLSKFYEKKPLLPKYFVSRNHLEEVKGIYVPFWFFDGVASGSARFEATRTHRNSRSDGVEVITRHYNCYRSGKIGFSMVPVDGSKKMDDDMMDSIEPFDYSELKDFSTAFLPGYLADIYDVSAEECFERADRRCENTLVNALRATVCGYDTCSLRSRNVVLHRGAVHYGLLPVYILSTACDDKRYMFAVNGQTGKVAGNLPISGWKSLLALGRRFLISAAAGVIIFLLVSRYLLS